MRQYFSKIGLVLAILITAYFAYMIFSMKPINGGSYSSSVITPPDNIDTAFGGLLFSHNINDTLPHYKYKQIADSLDRIKQARELDDKSFGIGSSFGQLGMYEITNNSNSFYGSAEYNRIVVNVLDSLHKLIADSLNRSANKKNPDSIQMQDQQDEITHRLNEAMRIKSQEREDKETKQYYLGIGGYTLDNDTRFYMNKGTYNLLYVKRDSIIKGKYQSREVAHFESKQIPIRYAADDKRILIPVSKTSHDIIGTLLYVLFAFSVFIGVYVFLGMPLQILINISKGRAFTEKNIRMFRIMSLVLFIYIVISIFGQYLLRLFFYKLIPGDFKLPNIFNSFINNLYPILIAFTLFFISRAFRKGYLLQKENELTV